MLTFVGQLVTAMPATRNSRSEQGEELLKNGEAGLGDEQHVRLSSHRSQVSRPIINIYRPACGATAHSMQLK